MGSKETRSLNNNVSHDRPTLTTTLGSHRFIDTMILMMIWMGLVDATTDGLMLDLSAGDGIEELAVAGHNPGHPGVESREALLTMGSGTINGLSCRVQVQASLP